MARPGPAYLSMASSPDIAPNGPVAVLGAGTIGASWAALFLAHGSRVHLWDPDPNARARFSAALDHQVEATRQVLGLVGVIGRWSFFDSVAEAVATCVFVQENGPEDRAAKRALYGEIGVALTPDAIVASSTSSIMPSDLQEGCAFADRLLVGHPFNPPHLIPLVEVIGGRSTAEDAMERATEFYRSVGKHPIRLHTERPGHLANRLQAALWREAVEAVASGAATVADVDAAVTHALGPRWAIMGPHATFHLAGGQGGLTHFIDHLGPAFVRQWDDLRQPELTTELATSLAEGVGVELDFVDVGTLARERDRELVKLLQTIKPLSEKT